MSIPNNKQELLHDIHVTYEKLIREIITIPDDLIEVRELK
jgi:hypothetical protein